MEGRRSSVEVAVVLVPKTHALYLQNDLICALDPRDNRLICGEIYESELDDPAVEFIDEPPRGYDYDIPEILNGIFYNIEADAEIPF